MAMEFRNILDQKDGVFILSEIKPSFESQYIKLRKAEQRIYEDQTIAKLPTIHKSNPHYNEWKLRAKTVNRFLPYIQLYNAGARCLDLGCGNGWFTNQVRMALPASRVTGLDINLTELKQARRIFDYENLTFAYGDIFECHAQFINAFDLIILNASIQYFPSISELMQVLKPCLRKGGEIHILDSPFYHKEMVTSARNRSRMYFKRIGFPEMSKFYYHHTFQEIQHFEILYRPKGTLIRKIIGKADSPFLWLRWQNII